MDGRKMAKRQRIVVVKPGAIGDTVVTAPALRALREGAPGVEIVFVGTRPQAEMLALFGVADKVVSYDRYDLFGRGGDDEPARGADVVAFLGDAPSDRAEPFTGKGARRVVWREPAPRRGGCHVVEHIHACFRELIPGIAAVSRKPFAAARPEKRFGHAHRPEIADGLSSEGPYSVLLPGAGSEAKRAPLERFIEAAEEEKRRGRMAVFVVGEAEVESGLAEAVPREYPRLVSPALACLAGVLAYAEKVYANDSGPGHIAGLVGADVTVFFGPTDPEVWRPWGERVTIACF